MLKEAESFWTSIAGKVRRLIQSETQNTFRCERYDVTTAPADGKIGVTLPLGQTEIFIPYSAEVESATVGDTVLVVWWGSMSNAKAYYFGNGYAGASGGGGAVTSVNGQTGAVQLSAPDVDALPETAVLHISIPAFSSLPQTYSNAGITSTMRVIEATWGTPGVVTSDITWTTADGSITLSGTISGSTTLDLILLETN